jgi:hypothetical protein
MGTQLRSGWITLYPSINAVLIVVHAVNRTRERERVLHPTIQAMRVMTAFLASTAAMLTAYEVMKRANVSKPGAYKITSRLAQAGWLTGKLERHNPTFGLPPRMLYEVTPEGMAKARAMLELFRVST